jgi:mono/diheme cytochrome c family protein
MSSLCRRPVVILGAAACVLALGSLTFAAGTDVPFSARQAERGHQLYLARCVLCHGANLEGVSAPSLVGDDLATPDTPSIGDVFTTIVHRMPKSNPGTLAPSDATDIEAFLLSSNGFASGAHDLTAEAAAASGVPYLRHTQAP